MNIMHFMQGSPEWLAYRARHFNASDAPAMLGCSPYKTRAQLLRELHTGLPAEVDVATQKRFDNGHRAETLARPLAEEIIGEDLYPVVGSSGRLSASFDGLTLDESTCFEHKALNADLRAAFRAIADGAGQDALPLHHRVQMEQQMHVSGASRVLFMASEWDADGNLIEQHSAWYLPDDALRGQILAGWAQFERDLAAYVLPESPEPAPVGHAPETLPALRIEVTGAVTASNLAEFKATALATIRSVNRTLTTDQHFADAERAVKWCADVEARLKAAKEHALSQTADIDALFKALDDIGAEARTVRLDLDKLVTRRKAEVKEEAVCAARRALDQHVAELNAELAPMRVPQPAADFAGAIKGLKSLDSMRDKLDQALTVAKIATEADARAIRANVAAYRQQAAGFEFLFADLGQIVHKAGDDFATVLQARIAQHQAAEAERERQRAAAEAQRIAAAEQRAREQEAQRLAAEEQARQAAAAAAASAAAVPAPAPAQIAQPATVAVPPQPRRDEPATLNLGAIAARLGFVVPAAFLADTLGVRPALTTGKAALYTEAQFMAICRALAAHVGAVAARHAQAEAMGA
jgi:putative phage-type endonuclease